MSRNSGPGNGILGGGIAGNSGQPVTWWSDGVASRAVLCLDGLAITGQSFVSSARQQRVRAIFLFRSKLSLPSSFRLRGAFGRYPQWPLHSDIRSATRESSSRREDHVHLSRRGGQRLAGQVGKLEGSGRISPRNSVSSVHVPVSNGRGFVLSAGFCRRVTTSIAVLIMRAGELMDIEAVRNALPLLDSYLGRASDALTQIEADTYGDPGYGEPIGYPDPHAALAANLDDLKETVALVLDAAGMQASIEPLLAAWATFKKRKNGLRDIDEGQEGQYSYSAPLDHMRRLVQALRSCTEDGPTVGELKRLEDMLRRTHVLVHGRKSRADSGIRCPAGNARLPGRSFPQLY